SFHRERSEAVRTRPSCDSLQARSRPRTLFEAPAQHPGGAGTNHRTSRRGCGQRRSRCKRRERHIWNEPVVFVEKSRTLMISWLCVGFFTHAAMSNDQREVLFQSQKEDKAAELVDYAKTLYEEQDERLKRRFPLAKPLREQAALRIEFANGSRI